MSQAVRLTPHETVRRLEHFRKERIVKVLNTPDGVPPPDRNGSSVRVRYVTSQAPVLTKYGIQATNPQTPYT